MQPSDERSESPSTMARLIISIVLFWTTAALAADALDSRVSDDIALTKATVALLAVKDFVAVRDRIDPAIGQVSDNSFRQMSDLIGAGDPVSIETVSVTGAHNVAGDGNSRIVLEYELTGKWLVVDAVVNTKNLSKRFSRLYLTANALPLRELNAFQLFGKGPVQYLFLAGWIGVIVLTAWAITAAFRRHTGWRRWVLIFLMPLGLTPTVAMNWNTAEVWVMEATNLAVGRIIPFFAARYPMALFSNTQTRAPFLYVSAPLIALGYLIWHRIQKRQPLEMSADRAN